MLKKRKNIYNKKMNYSCFTLHWKLNIRVICNILLLERNTHDTNKKNTTYKILENRPNIDTNDGFL